MYNLEDKTQPLPFPLNTWPSGNRRYVLDALQLVKPEYHDELLTLLCLLPRVKQTAWVDVWRPNEQPGLPLQKTVQEMLSVLGLVPIRVMHIRMSSIYPRMSRPTIGGLANWLALQTVEQGPGRPRLYLHRTNFNALMRELEAGYV